MNRKDLNNIIEKVLPLSSTVIGAPRRSGNMNTYLEKNPSIGKMEFCNLPADTHNEISVPDFFGISSIEPEPACYLASLYNARVWGANGAVIGSNDYFINDVSREFNKGLNIEHSVFYTIRQVKAKQLPGVTAVIGTAGANIYYHWMIDVLPRLAIIRKFKDLNTVDYFVTGFTNLPFQEQTLEKIGIPLKKIVRSNANWDFHIGAELLLTPSLAGHLDQPNFFQVNFLKSLYKDHISSALRFRRIYISRKKTGSRSIVNESELIDSLSRFAFEIINCEELQVAEQVKLFSEAKIIICSHGSALTNLVFCQPQTVVVDIFNPSYVNACFWFIAQINKLDYHYLSGVSVSIDGNPKNDQTVVDTVIFNQLLQLIGLS